MVTRPALGTFTGFIALLLTRKGTTMDQAASTLREWATIASKLGRDWGLASTSYLTMSGPRRQIHADHIRSLRFPRAGCPHLKEQKEETTIEEPNNLFTSGSPGAVAWLNCISHALLYIEPRIVDCNSGFLCHVSHAGTYVSPHKLLCGFHRRRHGPPTRAFASQVE